jgi:predicted nucleotidyltransferase
MFYIEVFKKLNEKKIRYLIIGGVAVNLYGFPRLTFDLDLMLDLNDFKSVSGFVDSMNELGFKPVIPVKIEDFIDPENRRTWSQEKNMKVFSLYNPLKEIERVDVLVENYVNFNEAYDRRKNIDAEGITLPLLSIDDLINIKKIANRKRDIIDIEALEKIKEIENEK